MRKWHGLQTGPLPWRLVDAEGRTMAGLQHFFGGWHAFGFVIPLDEFRPHPTAKAARREAQTRLFAEEHQGDA